MAGRLAQRPLMTLGVSLRGISVSVGDTFDVDIWMRECPGSATNGGFRINYDESLVQITAVNAYNQSDIIPGPWMPAGTSKHPDVGGPGTYATMVVNLAAAVPNGLNDLIVYCQGVL